MPELTPIPFDDHQIRGQILDGKPWFVANDICAALGIGNPRNVISRIDEGCVRQADVIDHMGRPRATNLVNEPGMYAIIFRSDKPEAKKFQNFVFDDVLPQIREFGDYRPDRDPNARPVKRLPSGLPDWREGEAAIHAMQEMIGLMRERHTLEVANSQQRRELEAARPRASFVDNFVAPTADASLIKVVAQQLGCRERAFREWLVERKVIYRRPAGQRWSVSQNRWVDEYDWAPYSAYATWFVIRDQPEAPRMHNGQLRTTLYVTPVGKEKIRELIARHGGPEPAQA